MHDPFRDEEIPIDETTSVIRPALRHQNARCTLTPKDISLHVPIPERVIDPREIWRELVPHVKDRLREDEHGK